MKVRLDNVRLAFPNLFEAKQVQGQGEAKFSACFLLTKDHPQLATVKEAITTAAKEKWADKAPEVIKALFASDKLALHDGDAKSGEEGYAGNYFINASNKIRPLVVGGGPDGLAPLSAMDGKIYSGCYVSVMLEFWAQDNQFGKRVNASLLGVQFTKDGERLAGGGIASQDDFDAHPGTAAAGSSAPTTSASLQF